MADNSHRRAVPADPSWSDDELRTLVRFRARVGRRWKARLLNLYLSAQDANEPEGPGLRYIRNHQGPSRVHALKASVLDKAAIRLATPG